MADKQLIVIVDVTAAMGPYWQTILSDYLEKIIRFLVKIISFLNLIPSVLMLNFKTLCYIFLCLFMIGFFGCLT